MTSINDMTQEQARAWLIKFDPEGAEYWAGLPDDTDFLLCVLENIADFGPV